MGILSAASLALEEMDRRRRAESYVNDPVKWAEEVLGVKLWRAQREILESVRDNRATAVAAGHGVGKDLPLDTPLPTPTGWTTMGDVQPGDYVLDEMGRPTKVLTKSEVFHHEQYEIKFLDGESIVASGTHLWNVIPFAKAKRLRRRGVTDWRDHWDATVTMSTRDMLDTGVLVPNGPKATASNFLIPMHRPLELPEADLPVDPYVFGAWLGDGSSNGAMMTIGDKGHHIIEEFAKRGYELKKMKADLMYSFGHQGFVKALRPFDVVGPGKKRIPMIYLRASIEQRRELLRGIMDTDGFRGQNGSVGIDLANERLANDVAELVRSLGIKVNVRPGRMVMSGRHVGTRYRMAFTPDFCPFSASSYKSAGWEPSRSLRNSARHIVSITPVESVPSQCISVDSPRSLYLAGRGMVVTHNTFVTAIACLWWVDVHDPERTFVASTAPTVDQVSLLWDNIRRFHSLMKSRYEQGLIDHPPVGEILGDNKWKLPNGALVGQGRRPATEALGHAFQGRHADYLLAIGDEAVGLPEELLNALGVIATGKFNRQLLLANPTDPSSAMAKIWATENPEWHRMHISVMDSPAIKPEPGFDIDAAPGISGWEFVNQAKSDYGCVCEDDEHANCDPRFIARVLGRWAFDAGNTVFTEADIVSAISTVVVPFPNARPRLGCDIARMGADWSWVYSRVEGEVWETDDLGRPVTPTGRTGWRIRRVGGWSKAPLVGDDPKNPGSAQRIHAIAQAEGAEVVVVDASGIGSGVIDGLVQMRVPYPVVEAFGGAASTDRRAYVNRRAEQFFELKRKMAAGELDLDPDDTELLDELRGIQFEYSAGDVLKIQSKDAMKKSPDRADAVTYCDWNIDELLGVSPGQKVMFEASSFDEDMVGLPYMF